MDIGAVVAAILSSGVFVSGAVFILKKSFEKALDTRMEKIKEENKAMILERSRRSAFIYDRQFQVLKQITTLGYQVRNNIRDLKIVATAPSLRQDRHALRMLDADAEALGHLLYEERLLLPQTVFAQVHSLKNLINDTRSVLSRGHEQPPAALRKALVEKLSEIDYLYNEILYVAQLSLGVISESEEQADELRIPERKQRMLGTIDADKE